MRELCLALPEAVEKPFGDHTSPAWRVNDKFFVMMPDDGVSVMCKAPKGVQEMLIASDALRFFRPKYVGHIGWVGVQLDLPKPPDWGEIGEMIVESFCLVAPKRVVAAWEASRAH